MSHGLYHIPTYTFVLYNKTALGDCFIQHLFDRPRQPLFPAAGRVARSWHPHPDLSWVKHRCPATATGPKNIWIGGNWRLRDLISSGKKPKNLLSNRHWRAILLKNKIKQQDPDTLLGICHCIRARLLGDNSCAFRLVRIDEVRIFRVAKFQTVSNMQYLGIQQIFWARPFFSRQANDWQIITWRLTQETKGWRWSRWRPKLTAGVNPPDMKHQ